MRPLFFYGVVFLPKKEHNSRHKLTRKAEMNASRVIITNETRAKLNNQALSPMKKRQLREQLIIESIRKATGGLRTKQELVAAAGHNPVTTTSDYTNGLTLINSMVKRGIISHNNTNQFKKVWSVTADVKVKQTPKQVAEEIVHPVQPAEPTVELKPFEQLSSVKLSDMAKEYAWRENSDSLRGFIAYVTNAIK